MVLDTVFVVASLVDRFVAHIAPYQCVSCGYEGSVLCADCLMTAGEPSEPRCFGCGSLSAGSMSCCDKTNLCAVYVATEFQGIYKRLVHEFKFGLRRQAADQIAQIMLPVVSPLVGSKPFIVCPVPTAPSRIRSRGFDHMYQLANVLTRLLQESGGCQPMLADLLRRRTNSRQLGASRDQRAAQVAGEFTARNSLAVVGANILLIDDVVTTGATLESCANILLKAGAAQVSAVVFAQKM